MKDPNGVTRRQSTRRERLTRERVVAAALEVVDRHGLGGLTMRALGRELGVDPMAAYYWFPNKQAILQGVGEATLADVQLPVLDAGSPWQDVLIGTAHSYRAALLRHPHAVPVVATQPVITPRGLDVAERVLSALIAGGLSPGPALERLNAMSALVIGLVLAQTRATPGTKPIETVEVDAIYAALDGSRFPATVAALGAAGAVMGDDDAQFERAIDALIRGLGH